MNDENCHLPPAFLKDYYEVFGDTPDGTDPEIAAIAEHFWERGRASAVDPRHRTWFSILDTAAKQDIKWKIPMPDLSTARGVFVWALKASEEMGELSAALLAEIGNRGMPDNSSLEECDQLIAVLIRLRAYLIE